MIGFYNLTGRATQGIVKAIGAMEGTYGGNQGQCGTSQADVAQSWLRLSLQAGSKGFGPDSGDPAGGHGPAGAGRDRR